MNNQARQQDNGDIGMTTWHNPLKVPQRISLAIDGVGAKPRVLTWQPDERKQIPSMFDRAVQTVDGDCRIGGQAPALVNESSPIKTRLHEEHDQELQKRRARANATAAATAAAIVTSQVSRDLSEQADELAPAPDDSSRQPERSADRPAKGARNLIPG